ncbi:MAG: hypothetical protein NZM28_03640 [Fimbriimonadales bacterium]|nr:hypothetical protein [Fimbriimonadales bacterium]
MGFIISPTGLFERILAYAGEPMRAEYYNALADPAVYTLGVVWELAQTGLFGALCWGSWRLLRLHEIGRKWVLGCALVMVLWETGSPLLDRFVWEPQRQKYNLTLPEPRGGFRISLGMLYAGAAWYFLTRPRVKDAFLR